MSQEVIDFWFKEIEPSRWWSKDVGFDLLISRRFKSLHARATRCELWEWRKEARGRLAEIIVLDQFSRNLHRDLALAFSNDSLALALAQEAISAQADLALTSIEKSFLYMPFMHSESMEIHERAAGLYKRNGIESNYDFELKHKEIIDEFGRYPHRNSVLGRVSTPLEVEFLRQPGSTF